MGIDQMGRHRAKEGFEQEEDAMSTCVQFRESFFFSFIGMYYHLQSHD